MTRTLGVGETAPDFSLPSQNGTMVKLSDFADKNVVVLYFYPKDFTPGCTTEACAFRDNFEEFMDLGARVIGVSSDSVESHKRFAQKHNLPFLLLSDADHQVREAYGATKLAGLPGRTTFVIDKKGVIRMVFESSSAKEHIEEAKKVVQLLTQ